MSDPNTSWYYMKHGVKAGPVSDRELKALAKANVVLPDDLVWKDGLKDWVPGRKLKGLFPEERGDEPSKGDSFPPTDTSNAPPPEGSSVPSSRLANAPMPRNKPFIILAAASTVAIAGLVGFIIHLNKRIDGLQASGQLQDASVTRDRVGGEQGQEKELQGYKEKCLALEARLQNLQESNDSLRLSVSKLMEAQAKALSSSVPSGVPDGTTAESVQAVRRDLEELVRTHAERIAPRLKRPRKKVYSGLGLTETETLTYSAEYDKVTFDIKKTESLVSPYEASVRFHIRWYANGQFSSNQSIDCKYDYLDGKWEIRTASRYVGAGHGYNNDPDQIRWVQSLFAP